MKNLDKNLNLRKQADQLVNFTPDEINNIGSDEIQRILYDMQVYQIELEMQNEELEKIRHELEISRNRIHLLYHQIPAGIATINHQGFIIEANYNLGQMLGAAAPDLVKQHITSLLVEEDKNHWINRFDAFFKRPDNKSMLLRLQGSVTAPVHVKILGKRLHDSDFDEQQNSIAKQQLMLTLIDVSDIVKNK